jgi:predicted HNH restriction endonuclease
MPLKSCKYCGRIHKKEFICPMKPKNNKYKTSEADKFRWTRSWQKKRDDIRRRDKHLCQICIRKLYNTINKYNYNNLEVHHIVPIKESYDLRLEDTNLITLCEYHHELAEQGTIPRDELLSIVKAQEEAENI